MQLKKISVIVKEILIHFPECRDNDNLLILKVWAEQEPKLRSSTVSFYDFARKFKESKFANTESIRRSRAKIEEEVVELRGKKYAKRHNYQETIKSELKEIKADLL